MFVKTFCISTNDRPIRIGGTIALVSADNPASAALGGFKESSSTYRCCRQCLGALDEIKKEVNSNVLCLGSKQCMTVYCML